MGKFEEGEAKSHQGPASATAEAPCSSRCDVVHEQSLAQPAALSWLSSALLNTAGRAVQAVAMRSDSQNKLIK
eukprot:2327522-Rhodomonas_salina.1